MCPSLVAQSSLFAPSKIENQFFHLPVYPAGQLPSASAFPSAAGEWLIYSVWTKSLDQLLTVKCFHKQFSGFLFSTSDLFSTCWCKHMKYFILQIILSLKQSFELLTDASLGVILYPEVVLNKQISTFTITEIFLRISNLQYISPKL